MSADESRVPEWLRVHRELQFLRAAASSTKRPRRSKKKPKPVSGNYVKERYKKLREVDSK